jgi:Spy/CpxP family protein refolding chaperone
MKTGKLRLTLLLLGAGVVAMAQPPQPPAPGDQQGPPGHQGMQMQMQPGPGRDGMQPAVRAFEERLLPGPHGKWWDNPQVAEQLALSADQKKKMDDIFQQYRMKLIDLNASVQKEELTMEPLVAADQPDEARIVAQIHKVAQARAELEENNARMLLAIRRLLTPEQYQKLQGHPHPGGRGQMGQMGQMGHEPSAPPAPPPPALKKQ